MITKVTGGDTIIKIEVILIAIRIVNLIIVVVLPLRNLPIEEGGVIALWHIR